MSYAEHGPRIFLAGRSSPNPVTRYGDIIVPRKRSEGRLKLFDSCTDLRAWSSNVLDNCRYFREVVENPLPKGKIVPYDVLIKSLNLLGDRRETELASVRQELQRYKNLRLTPEQEKQLRDDGGSSEDRIGPEDCTSLQRSSSTEDESPIPKRPETPVQSASSSSTNFHDIEVAGGGESDESSSEGNSEDSQEVLVRSETYSSDDADLPEKRRRRDRSEKNYRASETVEHQAVIIEKDSTIIALKNELGAKESELEEFRELSQRLESALSEKEEMIDDLKRNLRMSQEHVLAVDDQLHQRMEEWKKKMQASKSLIDGLDAALAEKSQECTEQSRAMQERIKECETLREERDCLIGKLDELKAVIRERNDLAKLNRQQAVNLADQEEEIRNLVELINRSAAKRDKREVEMECAIEDLRAKIEEKNGQLSEFEAHCVAIRREIGEAISFSELQTGEIRKIKRSLQDDLRELENELARRSSLRQEDDRYRYEETVSRPNDTIDRSNGTMAQWDDWERQKEFMECTIEKLTMQVSESNAAKDDQAEIHERIVSQFCTTFEKMQRLIVELEPYGEERPSLIEAIKCLNGALKEAQATAESREFTTQKQYLAEVSRKHRNQCEKYEKRIASLKSKIANLRNDRENIIEKFRREMDQRPDGTFDERIDDVLATRAKRSIETIEKLSAALRAGDYHDVEMAKKENELAARNAEIAKLREQVASSVSRGQGDQAERENSHEARRLADESKSWEFKFKGSERRVKELQGQCRKREQETGEAVRKIGRLEKEILGLNKTVLRAGELQTQVDEMQLRLESLQAENAKLIDEVSRANGICAEYKNTIMELTDREARASEALARAECELQTILSKRAREIEELRRENDTANEELEKKKLKIAELTEQIQCLGENGRKLEIIENLMSEVTNVDKRINRLHDEVATLKSHLGNHNRSNEQLERDLNSKLAENERLQYDIRALNENIEVFSSGTSMRESADEHRLLNTLPDKICDRIKTLRSRLNISELEDQMIRSEIEEWRAKSRDDTLLVESLQKEMKLYTDKAVQQDALIVALQEANAGLKTELEEVRAAFAVSSSKNSAEAATKLASRLEKELREKEEEIENLNSCMRTMKTEFSNLLKKAEDSHQAKLAELQQNYNTQMKQYLVGHNASIKRLEKQYEETLGKPFNPETWLGVRLYRDQLRRESRCALNSHKFDNNKRKLQSLSPKEIAELHKKICMAGPCEMVSESSKIRGSNDKQNQRQDEKLHGDMIHLRNGHHREPEIGSSYVYERRKFDTARYGPLETAFTNTDDMKKVNFVFNCANQHKHDGSH